MSVNKRGQLVVPSLYRGNDVYSNQYLNGNCSTSGFTKTIYNGYTNFHYEASKPSTDTWLSLSLPNFPFTSNTKYLYRARIRCNKCSNGADTHLRASRVSNDFYTGMLSKNFATPSLADGKWHEYFIIQTIPTSFTYNDTTYTSNPRWECYTANLKTATTDIVVIDFDIKDIEVLKAEAYTPISNLFTESTVLSIGKGFVGANDFYEI